MGRSPLDWSLRSSITTSNTETLSAVGSFSESTLAGVDYPQDQVLPTEKRDAKIHRGAEPLFYAWVLSLYFDEAGLELEAAQNTKVQPQVRIEEPSTQAPPVIRSKVGLQETPPSRDVGGGLDVGAKQDTVPEGSSVWSLVWYYLDQVQHDVEQENKSTSGIPTEIALTISDSADPTRYGTNRDRLWLGKVAVSGPIPHAESVVVSKAPARDPELKEGLPNDHSPSMITDCCDPSRHKANRNWVGCEEKIVGRTVGCEHRGDAMVVESNNDEDKREAGWRPEVLPSDSSSPAVSVFADSPHYHTNNDWTCAEVNKVDERGASAYRETRPAIVSSSDRFEQNTKHRLPSESISSTIADICDPFRYDTNSDRLGLNEMSTSGRSSHTNQDTPFSSSPAPFPVVEDRGSNGPSRSFNFEHANLRVEAVNKSKHICASFIPHRSPTKSLSRESGQSPSVRRSAIISKIHSKSSLPRLSIRVPSNPLQSMWSIEPQSEGQVPSSKLHIVPMSLLSPPLTPANHTPLRGILKEERKGKGPEKPLKHVSTVANPRSHPVSRIPTRFSPNLILPINKTRRSTSSTASRCLRTREPAASVVFRSNPPPVPTLPPILPPNSSGSFRRSTMPLAQVPAISSARLRTPPESPKLKPNPSSVLDIAYNNEDESSTAGNSEQSSSVAMGLSFTGHSVLPAEYMLADATGNESQANPPACRPIGGTTAAPGPRIHPSSKIPTLASLTFLNLKHASLE